MSPLSRDSVATRPSRLKINKESHTITKPSSSATSATSSTSTHRNQPIIIYTSPPKVIHTEARDFMALVQKLTGLNNNNNSNVQQEPRSHHRPPLDLSCEENYNVMNGDRVVQFTSSSNSSNSVSPSEAVSSPTVVNEMPKVQMPAKANSSDFLYMESPYYFYPELAENLSSTNGWIHANFD